jgi:hypothetical protein
MRAYLNVAITLSCPRRVPGATAARVLFMGKMAPCC